MSRALKQSKRIKDKDDAAHDNGKIIYNKDNLREVSVSNLASTISR